MTGSPRGLMQSLNSCECLRRARSETPAAAAEVAVAVVPPGIMLGVVLGVCLAAIAPGLFASGVPLLLRCRFWLGDLLGRCGWRWLRGGLHRSGRILL